MRKSDVFCCRQQNTRFDSRFSSKEHEYQIFQIIIRSLLNLIIMVAQTVAYSDIGNKQIGLGIALVVTGLIAGALLQYTRRIRYMPSYLVANFSFFKDKSPKITILATILYFIILATPVILLIVWVIILGVTFGPNPALPILFLSIFIGLIFLPSYNKLFYFKILAVFIAYITAESLALGLVFEYESRTSFWTLTALCLTVNSLFVIIAMWFMDETIWTIPQDVHSTLKDKIIKEIGIWKQKEEPPEIINAGLYGKVLGLSRTFRYIAIVVTYICSMIILIIYSVIGKIKTDSNYQALVNSVAVVTTDIITFMLLVISRKIGLDPNLNSLFVIAVRVCIVAFSGPFWFFGYCLLYLILMVYSSVLLINKFYPAFEKPPTGEVKNTNILKMPETVAILWLLIFSALVYFMGVDGGKNLPVSQAQIGEGIYPFWAIGVATILLSFATFFYLVSLRIVQRSRMKIRSAHSYYLGCEGFSQYYVFIFASYSFLVILGFYLYSVVGAKIIWASCVFLPLFYQSFTLFYQNWKENDYLILGDVAEFNKKLKKQRDREEKIQQMRKSVITKMKEENKDNEEAIMVEQANVQAMDNAKVEQNWVIDNYDLNNVYVDWKDNTTFFEAFRAGKLLPTDKRIIISIPIMIASLVAYSLTFFYTENRNMTAFTVSVEILVLFLIFVPIKRYFSTFERLNVTQIVSFILGIVLNYAFGIISYVVGWNNSPAYTVLWAIVNLLLVAVYAAVSLIRDKGLIPVTIVVSVASMLISFGPGIILLAWFKSIAVGIALIGVGFYYSYFLGTVLIYKKMNNSVPFAVYPITIIIIVLTCCAVMIYAFVNEEFDDFYGFSITYLAVNLLGLLYAIYRFGSDILSRIDKPNFYSPYGSPIYKYDFSIKSVVQNEIPIKIWLIFWFMFYLYTILMQIFIVDTNYGTSTSMIPLLVFSLTFFYVVTYNANRAGKIKDDITEQILEASWDNVLQAREKNLGDFLKYEELQNQLQEAIRKRDGGEKTIKSKALKIQPKGNLNEESEMNQTTTKMDTKAADEDIDIDHYIYNLQTKLGKAAQNEKILLVNFWTTIIFKAESKRKKRMLEFISFIKDCGDILASTGISLVLNDNLYDLELIYNQAFQQMHTLSALQRVFFSKQLKLYLERKEKQEKERDEVHKKEIQNDIIRQKEIENKILKDDKDDDQNLPLQKMKDGPLKLKKIKQTLKTDYTDGQFKTINDFIPSEVRSLVKGWKRPSKKSYVMKNQLSSGMEVRQGSIGNCYLISAIGVLGKDRIRQIISDPSQCPPGAYMVKFQKFGKNIYVIIDDTFPVADPAVDNYWLFGRCEDEKELFCNIIEKAYAKLYGGYNKIVGGKVALALSDLTGGFPEQIQLKPYQETNTNQIFEKMLQFKKAGYLMGAGSPPNAKGDAVQVDGIYQGHAYLILDVRNLDGNKLIKLRNPHGNESKQSTLDWSDDSPKWNARLKGLLGQSLASDGAFWMGLDDFVYCFRALYICRIFDSSWKRVGPLAGQWKGTSAAGLKSSSGSTILANNPHFGIKVNKACTLFVELTQNEIAAEGSGKNQIFFMIQRNAGKRIDAPATNKLAGMSGPAINSKTISKEISLVADSFPYTFSLMTATYMAGSEGTFSLSMYCNDASIEVIEDAVFGR